MSINSIAPMIRILLALLFLLGGASHTCAQPDDWQQQIRYEMDIQLFPDGHTLSGQQQVTYVNNSPDTLRTVYYHLYYNAFTPHSMMAARNRNLPDPDSRVVPRIFNLDTTERGLQQIHSLHQDGEFVPFEIHDTILRGRLPQPIPPGDSTRFTMNFRTEIPLMTRRGGRNSPEGVDYSMSQWYPKIAAYDEDGWHADPYVGREFYAPFGSFNVQIDAPAEYTLGATGRLVNPAEVGHGYGNADEQVETTARDTLTWHFRADRVHDFAWSADTDYIHDTITGPRNTTIHLLYLPEYAQGWKQMKNWFPRVMQFFQEEYGPYPYDTFTIAQAGDGGMEYPQIVFITGGKTASSLVQVTVHEAAHQWFYNMLATNESDYAWMDEGFTSYATTEAIHWLTGQSGDPDHHSAYLNVLYAQHFGLFERLNTPADWFQTNLGYGIASYPGGEMVIDMLGGVISDSLRDRWLQEYTSRYRFHHPKPEDVERLAEDISGLRLDWYFEQWLNTTRACDYAVDGLRSTQDGTSYATELTVRRLAPIVMPVDLRLTFADSTHQWVTIPRVIMQGHKPVPDDWIVSEPWPWTKPSFEVKLSLPKKVVKAEVDPRATMPDQNRLNNVTELPTRTSFARAPDGHWETYAIGWRPLATYAHSFGPGLGLRTESRYLFDQYETTGRLLLWPRPLVEPLTGDQPDASMGSALWSGLDYDLRFTHRIPASKLLSGQIQTAKNLGVMENRLSTTWSLQEYPSLSDTRKEINLTFQHQFSHGDRVYTADSFPVFLNAHIPSVRVGYRWQSDRTLFQITGAVGTSLQRTSCSLIPGAHGSCIGSQHQSASRLALKANHDLPLGPFTAKGYFQAGVGMNNLAFHKRFRLGAPTFEQQWRNDALRTLTASTPYPLQNLHLTGVRFPGPFAYLLNDRADGPIGATPWGTQIVSASLAVHTQPFPTFPALAPLSVEAFISSGVTGGTAYTNDLLSDAGLGLTYRTSKLAGLSRWISQSSILEDLNLTIKFPIWASRPGLTDPEDSAVAFRWMGGITHEL